jgi:hypothetical protein
MPPLLILLLLNDDTILACMQLLGQARLAFLLIASHVPSHQRCGGSFVFISLRQRACRTFSDQAIGGCLTRAEGALVNVTLPYWLTLLIISGMERRIG